VNINSRSRKVVQASNQTYSDSPFLIRLSEVHDNFATLHESELCTVGREAIYAFRTDETLAAATTGDTYPPIVHKRKIEPNILLTSEPQVASRKRVKQAGME